MHAHTPKRLHGEQTTLNAEPARKILAHREIRSSKRMRCLAEILKISSMKNAEFRLGSLQSHF